MAITFGSVHYIKTNSHADAVKIKETVEGFAAVRGLKPVEGFFGTEKKDLTILTPFETNIDRFILTEAVHTLRKQKHDSAANQLEQFTATLMKNLGYTAKMIKDSFKQD